MLQSSVEDKVLKSEDKYSSSVSLPRVTREDTTEWNELSEDTISRLISYTNISTTKDKEKGTMGRNEMKSISRLKKTEKLTSNSIYKRRKDKK